MLPEATRRNLSLSAWIALAEEARRRAAAEVAEALGSDFEPAGLEPAAAGPVAVIAQRSTGIAFHLIPGGRFVQGLTDEEEVRLRRAFDASRAIARKEGKVSSDEQKLVEEFLSDLSFLRPCRAVEVPPFLLAARPLGEHQISHLLPGEELDDDDDDDFAEDDRYAPEEPAGPNDDDDDLDDDFEDEDDDDFDDDEDEADALATPAGHITPERIDAAEVALEMAGLRLPSESEWEWACRGGGSWLFPDGDGIPTSPWPRANRFAIVAIGAEPEVCADRWHDDYRGAPASAVPWLGDDPDRVIRGGAVVLYPWQGCAEWLLLLCSNRTRSSMHEYSIALRPALSL